MSLNLFISYSRAQTPFVDRLADQLEHSGYSIWLDYQDLVPARPWQAQIESWIDSADAVLLIVSRESLASRNVEPEWKRAVDRGKRIILLLFEAVPLPPALQQCEWVDFRSTYAAAYRQLTQQIEQPTAVSAPAPQTGFRAPAVFWISLALSVIVLFGSIPAWWTLLLPYVLVPLPRRIYTRSYIFHQVLPTLIVLPLVYWLSWWTMFSSSSSIFYDYRDFAATWFPLSLVAGWILAALLLTPDMQRRGLPEAARVRFANPLVPADRVSRPVSFVIDHAPQDIRYAERLRQSLEQNGHQPAPEGEASEASFALLSTYKKETVYDPQGQAVYPVLLQSVREIDPEVQRIQWLDFRSGIHNVDTLARLLPEPERLLKGLAVPPTGSQEVFPFAVSALQYFTLVTGLLQGGGLLLSLLALLIWALRGNSVSGAEAQILGLLLNGLLLLGAMKLNVEALRSRAKGASAVYPLLVLNVFQILISFSSMLVILVYQLGADLEAEERLLSMASRVSSANWNILPVALLAIGLILLVRWRELYLWLPRRRDDSVSPLESWLLLYSPSRRGILVLHLIFHGLLFLLYICLNLWSIFTGFWFVPYLVLCCILLVFVLIGLRYWSMRLSR